MTPEAREHLNKARDYLAKARALYGTSPQAVVTVAEAQEAIGTPRALLVMSRGFWNERDRNFPQDLSAAVEWVERSETHYSNLAVLAAIIA